MKNGEDILSVFAIAANAGFVYGGMGKTLFGLKSRYKKKYEYRKQNKKTGKITL
jgi:hypothetical protein